MESALLVKGKISNEVPSDTVSVSGNDYRGYSNGKDEPRYSLEQIQLILQRAQRHEIARETARTEQVQRSALENYLRTNLKTNDAVEGASLSTVYEVARQNMGLSNEDVDWALKNCAFSSERVRELLKANGIEDSKGCSQRKKIIKTIAEIGIS